MNDRTFDTVSYELADTGTRLIALIIDSIILGIITGVLVGAGRGAGAGLSFLIGLAYNWYFWTRNNGQTPGKMFTDIRVIKADGSPMRDADALMRFIGYYLNSIALGIGWLWALIDPNRQGWHDKL